MAHLGEDVAAFVDGQLPPAASAVAAEHLTQCEQCRHAVAQQRLLKARMSGAVPEPRPHLIAALGALPASPRRTYSLVPGAIGALLVLIGASMVVVAAAYTVAPSEHSGDLVAPRFDRFAAISSSMARPSQHLSPAAMDALDASGWPSREKLGVGLFRVDGHLHDGRDVVAQVYIGHGDTLLLFEQVGALDESALRSFRREVVADRAVWVHHGHPRMVTWDADGMIYTVVSDLPDSRLGRLLDDLPAPPPPPTPVERIGAGLVRMTSWLR